MAEEGRTLTARRAARTAIRVTKCDDTINAILPTIGTSAEWI